MRTKQNVFSEHYNEIVGAWVEVRIYAYKQGLLVAFGDISERRKAADILKESEKRFREMIALTPAGYVATDGNGIVTVANNAFYAMSGYTPEELIGHDIMQLLPACPLGGALQIKSGISTAPGKETDARHKSGNSIYVLANLAIKRDNDGNALGLSAFVTDITERKEAETQLETIASQDALTGLPNRAQLSWRLHHLLTSYKDESIAVMFIDLDRFKEVNDTMGNTFGDRLLTEVATRLKACMRPSDIIARLGGDEFIVAAHCASGRSSAATIAQRLLEALSSAFHFEGRHIFIGASIGISMYYEDALTEEILFQNADTAMY